MRIENPSLDQNINLLDFKFDKEVMPLVAGRIIKVVDKDVRVADLVRHFWDEQIDETDYYQKIAYITGAIEGYLMNNQVSQAIRESALLELTRYLNSLQSGDKVPSRNPVDPTDSFMP